MTAKKKSDLGGWDKPLRVKDETDKVIVEGDIRAQNPDEIRVSKNGKELIIEGRKPHEHYDLRLPSLAERSDGNDVRVESSEAGLSVVVPKTPEGEPDRTEESQ